jgi:PadR family transcriptional regulator, regulatory protein PadR
MRQSESLGEFEQAVLLAIARLAEAGEEIYGVTIRQTIEARTGRPVAVGALYTALDRLERKGFVSSTMGQPTAARGGRAKRYFVLRPAGATALQRSREYMARMWEGVGHLPTRTRP